MENNNILRPLGRTGIMLTPIGLGCWQFSKKGGMAGRYWPMMEDEVINRIVAVSLQGGINWFDTAEAYGKGASERALSKALLAAGSKPGEVIVATKWMPVLRTASNILKTIDKRIDALKPFPIDLHQVHMPWGLSNQKDEMAAMAELFESKIIRSIGVSNFSAKQMRRTFETLAGKGIPLASNQVEYSLLNRKIERNGVLNLAKELGITIIAYSPLAQGLLTGKFHDNPELIKETGIRKFRQHFRAAGMQSSKPVIMLLKEMAVRYHATPGQVALNWLVNFHGETVVAIPGATKECHALENSGVMKFTLSGEDMNRLDKVSQGF
jgi:aryl-alcohol dehydrogenase-like predicted oxidoreductase